ncbi:hypothetical protein D8B22_18980 [Verminephrobacter aporrectodeae subsp. tuberculatae]|uniref:hypothetical protein n=1 Tax=Verminephrobacter aporrectodeae TaxID=1110389 RepID=UPI0022440184|nr:hypothetical protein [Verminephrobacter aporrectodeae]MCW8167017.1 hypothetical protein [Verminephrobacter aporrectodeae subsp. tuberculatae]MCW8171136.1 hypothetical protein [Verminephrobacter aporrectodeae subsp. tuberculatae]
MVLNMDETRLTTIAQIEQFLLASAVVHFTPSQDDEDDQGARQAQAPPHSARQRGGPGDVRQGREFEPVGLAHAQE